MTISEEFATRNFSEYRPEFIMMPWWLTLLYRYIRAMVRDSLLDTLQAGLVRPKQLNKRYTFQESACSKQGTGQWSDSLSHTFRRADSWIWLTVYGFLQDGCNLHFPLLCSWHCKHVPRQSVNPIQRILPVSHWPQPRTSSRAHKVAQGVSILNHLHWDPAPPPNLPYLADVR